MKIFTVVFTIAVLALTGCGGETPSEANVTGDEPEPGAAASAASAVKQSSQVYEVYSGIVKRRDEPPVVTLAEFEKVQNGIDYAHAMEIVGAPADTVVDETVGSIGASRRTATWYNGDGSSMKLMFMNMRVMQKEQQGLN